MKKKLLGCVLSTLVIMGGTLVLAAPAQAAMTDGCPADWISACGTAPPGCYISGTCTVGPDGKPQIQCSINC